MLIEVIKIMVTPTIKLGRINPIYPRVIIRIKVKIFNNKLELAT